MVEKLIAGVSALALTATIATTTPEIVEVFDGSQEAVTLEASADYGIMPLAAGAWSLDSWSYTPPTPTYGTAATPVGRTAGMTNDYWTYIPTKVWQTQKPSTTQNLTWAASSMSGKTAVMSYQFPSGVYGINGTLSLGPTRFVTMYGTQNSDVRHAPSITTAPSSVVVTVGSSSGSSVTIPASISSSGYNGYPCVVIDYSSATPFTSISVSVTYSSGSLPALSYQVNSSLSYQLTSGFSIKPDFTVVSDPPPFDFAGAFQSVLDAISNLAGALGGSDGNGGAFGKIASDLGEIKDVVADPTDMAINEGMQGNKESFADFFVPGGENSTNENGTSAAVTPEQIEQVGEVSQNAQEMIDAGGSVEDAFSWASDSSLFSWFSDQTMQDLDGTAPAGVDDLDLVSYYEDLLADLQSQAYVDGFIMTRW